MESKFPENCLEPEILSHDIFARRPSLLLNILCLLSCFSGFQQQPKRNAGNNECIKGKCHAYQYTPLWPWEWRRRDVTGGNSLKFSIEKRDLPLQKQRVPKYALCHPVTQESTELRCSTGQEADLIQKLQKQLARIYHRGI